MNSIVCRDRCDSGVDGLSLGRCNNKKWSSFKVTDLANPDLGVSISGLSVKQYVKLKKFALVRITTLLEKKNEQQRLAIKFSWNRFK